jgi:hypothetical protein
MNAPLKHLYLSPTDAHADYVAWLTKEVQEAIDDPRPSLPHSVIVAAWEKEAQDIRDNMKETAVA